MGNRKSARGRALRQEATGRFALRYRALEPAKLDDARRFLDFVSERWDGAMTRLKAIVED